MTVAKKSKGFTLIELILAIMLMGIISLVIGKVLFQDYQIFLTSQNISTADWQGFLSLERMVNDIHNIRSASDISTISASSLKFTDINGNSVQYQLTGTNLMRNSQMLASGISSLSFSYLNKNGTVTAVASSVRYITITVVATQGTMNLTFTTTAGMRGMI